METVPSGGSHELGIRKQAILAHIWHVMAQIVHLKPIQKDSLALTGDEGNNTAVVGADERSVRIVWRVM